MTTTFEIDGAIAILTLNRPEARNALTWEMYEAVVAACDRADAEDSIRVLIVRGAGGKAFAAGTDISQFKDFRTRDDALAYERRLDGTLDRLERITKPTIAQIEGVAAGGGCGIAICCDIRVATPESTIGVPVARTLGNCLSGATTSRLLDIVGPAHAKDMLFTGRLATAAEAVSMGLVNRVVEAGAIGRTVRETAAAIAANAPLTIRASKEMIRRIAQHRRLPAGADHDLIEMCYVSDDFREGVSAFTQKRKPVWKGR